MDSYVNCRPRRRLRHSRNACPKAGLGFLNNRYHDSQLGRFISVDPLVAVTRDAYGYGNNNPITYSDPTGLVASRDSDCGADADCRNMAPGGRGAVWGDDGSYFGTPRVGDLGEFVNEVNTGLTVFASDFTAAGERGRSRQMRPGELAAYAHLQRLKRDGVVVQGAGGRLQSGLAGLPAIDFNVWVNGGTVGVETRLGSMSSNRQGTQDILDAVSGGSGSAALLTGFTCLGTACK